MPIEYLDPSIANEGQSANDWQPGAWTNVLENPDEWQPDIEQPHINDYAGLKKSKQYAKYFRPYRYQPFPAWLYHPLMEPRLIDVRHRDGSIDNEGCLREVQKLGPEWSPIPNTQRKDMTGKSLPMKSETQRMSETIAAALAQRTTGSGPIDAATIAAIVGAVTAAMKQPEPAKSVEAEASDDEPAERDALLQLAAERGIKVDGRWSNSRLAKELGV